MPTVKYDNLFEPELIDRISRGAVGVVPTDTVYGLVASAHDAVAVRKLYALKDRHQKPGTLVAASVEQLVALGVPKRYLTAVADYWPNPLSVIIPLGPDFDYLTMGVRSLAIRIPANEAFRAFLEKTGPLQTSSANDPGRPPATSMREAEAYFKDTVDYYVDGGHIEAEPSTIIRVVDDSIEIIREGALKIDDTGRLG